jgi:uncharacterized protein GlcG (DUF336 family)
MSVGKKITRVGLNLSEAQGCISRCVGKAKEIGIEISVAVVDEHGYLKSFARTDGAGWLSPDIAVGKAFTAVAFRRSTNESADRFKDRANFASSLNAIGKGKVVLVGGGLPLEKNNEIVGGIGVSGGTSEQDDECARAGLLTHS